MEKNPSSNSPSVPKMYFAEKIREQNYLMKPRDKVQFLDNILPLKVEKERHTHPYEAFDNRNS